MSGRPCRSVSHRLGSSAEALQYTVRIDRLDCGSKTMEAASRPAFEPLADLPVEEPVGLSGTGSPMGRTSPATTPPSTSVPPVASTGILDSEEDFLAYGSLLDLEPEGSLAPASAAPSASVMPE